MTRALAIAMLGCLALASPEAQSRPVTFEVASIRANTIGGTGKKAGDARTPVGTDGVMAPQGNQWKTGNVTVRTLIRFAYGPGDDDPATPPSLEEYQVAGGPAWIGSDAFDIAATIPEGPRRIGDLAVMLRGLLADRFMLKVHTETRELAAYALVRERSDEAPGDRLRRTSGLCVRRTGGEAMTGVPCGIRGGFQGLSGSNASMPRLALALSPIAGRPVVDRTGLDEGFDFQLRFSEDPAAADARFPSIFTALREQLGLKLESIRAPFEVLVIDRVERPTEN